MNNLLAVNRNDEGKFTFDLFGKKNNNNKEDEDDYIVIEREDIDIKKKYDNVFNLDHKMIMIIMEVMMIC